QQWGLLSEHVVPRLLERRPTANRAVWADGEVSDAVAVSLAYGQGRSGSLTGLDLFATSGGAQTGRLSYTIADLRGLPAPVRRDGFCRGAQGWVPAQRVAEQVRLGRPAGPVDLMVARGCPRGGRDQMAAQLRPGGYLLALGEARSAAEADSSLEAVDGAPLFRRRERGRGRPSARDTGEGSDAHVQLRTLAQKMLEEEMVGRHLNLARGLARRFAGHGEPLDDLRQVAFVGLVLAAGRYDPGQNASFSTYATATILGELKRYFRDKSWMMRVPRQVQETYLAIKTAREELYQELACSPTIDQIARRLRISEEAVLDAIEAGDNFMPQSLDAGPDDESPGRDVPVVDPAFDVMLERKVLMEAIPRLSKREQLVLKRVYLDGWTQRQVAQEIGVSQMQVSRLLHASAAKVRSWTGS
ncbi:MAG TPA: sigma-70 family RNA polymerase sigma factor, partial [Acidimicrobiales bacterium]|nr:sigma-70 family RNA polymerase sigma factor [Acidimicrobiales bacterium]